MDHLDNIVTAVSEIILVFEEAMNKPNVDIFIRTDNLDLVVFSLKEIVEEKEKISKLITEENFKEDYDRCTNEIQQSINLLLKFIESQSGGIVKKKDYEPLHKILHTILLSMVKQLKITNKINMNITTHGIKKFLDTLNRIKSIDNLSSLYSISPELYNNSQTLQNYLKKYLKELTNIEFKEKLQNSIDIIKNEVPNVILICKNAIETKTTENITKKENILKKIVISLQDSFFVIQESSKYIDNFALQFELPEVKVEDIPKVEQALFRLENAVKKKDSKEVEDACNQLLYEVKKQVAQSTIIANNMKDPSAKAALLQYIQQLQDVTPKLIETAKLVLNSPNDKNIQQNFYDLLNQAKLINNNINDAKKPEKAFLESIKELDALFEQLQHHLKHGNNEAALEVLQNINDKISNQIKLGRELAETIKDPILKKKILDACDELENLLPELITATKQLLQNPKDEKALKKLEEITKKMKDATDLISAIKRQANLESTIEKLSEAVKNNDTELAVSSAKEVIDQIQKQVEFGRKLASKCQDPILKKKILDACDELENLCPEIVKATKDALLNPNNKQIQQKLQDLLERAKKANKVIVDASEKMTKDSKQINNNNNNKTGIQKKTEISMAADQITLAAKEASKPSIPEQKTLLDIASAIGAEMEKLSLAAQNNSIKDMIAAAKNIASMIGKIEDLANQIAVKCTDPKLKENLLLTASVPKNFAIQLKIISAVKATSDKNDRSAAIQLVTCAKGLANSVVQTVKAADSASLKCPKK